MNERRVLTLWNEDGLNEEDITILRRASEEILVPFSNEAIRDIETLLSTFLSRNDALGLAAPQIGILRRAIVFRTRGFDEKDTWSKDRDYELLINPRITQARGELVYMMEGCLSCPEVQVEVGRYPEIKVRALDRDGKKINRRYTDFLARIVQHEIDHLEGKLIIDYEGTVTYPKRRSLFFDKLLK